MTRTTLVLTLFLGLQSSACDKDPAPLPTCVEHLACLTECTAQEGGSLGDSTLRCAEQCETDLSDSYSAIAQGMSAIETASRLICSGTVDSCDTWLTQKEPDVVNFLQETSRCLQEVQMSR